MPEIEIRPTRVEDIGSLMQLEHGYQTLYTWQMDRGIDGAQVSVRFHEVRFPRPVNVEYPRAVQGLSERWQKYQLMLTAICQGELVGYLGLAEKADTREMVAKDLVVRTDMRRQGIGSAILLSGQVWAAQHGSRTFGLEMQLKNYPMIQLANKLGFEFCGYHDHYFPNQDIALFFLRMIK